MNFLLIIVVSNLGFFNGGKSVALAQFETLPQCQYALMQTALAIGDKDTTVTYDCVAVKKRG